MSRKYNYMKLTEDELLNLGMLGHLQQPVEDRYVVDDPSYGEFVDECWWEAEEEHHQEIMEYLEFEQGFVYEDGPVWEPGWSRPSEEWWVFATRTNVMEDRR